MAIDIYELALRFKSEGFPAVKANLDKMDAQGKSLAARFDKLTSGFKALAGAGALVAVGGFLKKSIDEASDAEAALSELRGAIGNVGGDFNLLAKTFDATAQRMQRFTRYSDDETTRALAKLVTISGDTAGALKNIGLAADIAAFSHTDLNSAAEIVGRTMTGNTRGLLQFGIRTKDATAGLELLRAKMQGVAERDGATFQGRMEQVRNEFGNILEAIGKVIIGGDDAVETLGLLRDRFIQISTWIDSNADNWRGWASNAIKWVKEVEERMKKVERVAHAIYRFTHPGREPQGSFDDVTSGSSTTARDSLPPMVINGNRTSRGVATGGGGTDKGVAIPSFDFGQNVSSETMARIDQIGQTPEPFDMSNYAGMTADELEGFFKETGEVIDTGAEEMKSQILDQFGQTMADAVYNAFAIAFDGGSIGDILGAFGKSVLAGLGDIFAQQGAAMLKAGIILSAAAIGISNPFTSGPAMIAAGAALVALGAAFGAIAHGGGGRGTASAGAFRESHSGGDVIRLKFVDRPGYGQTMTPASPVTLNVYGSNDPAAQRWVVDTLKKAGRREA